MTIHIEVIPHSAQRYETCGDWWVNGTTLEVRVSELGDTNMEHLVAIHETIEALGCIKEGISEDGITTYDEAYENARKNHIPAPCGCYPTVDSEPGNDQHAPYRKWHQFATHHEKKLAGYFHVDWKAYEEKINSLSQ